MGRLVRILTWVVGLLGRLRDLSRAALDECFATDEARNAARSALIGELANAWLLLAADSEKLSVADDTRDTFERTLVLTQARFERGYASALDVRQAQKIGRAHV